MASALYAQVEETHGVAAQTQGGVQAIPVAAGGSGGATDKSGATWLGELLRGRTLQ
ncbi:hypothetical protein CBM2604_U10075 [Cupriavidus taiwanensis]|nr:hypothetical protein CBM2604_U10075 [Cupriavidus taiwanensis]SOZ53064.1 hypothetical protein CBM2610_U10073 [Cupriavidus taiwanensis]